MMSPEAVANDQLTYIMPVINVTHYIAALQAFLGGALLQINPMDVVLVGTISSVIYQYIIGWRKGPDFRMANLLN